MQETEIPFNEKESLSLITMMINKANDAYHDTGISAIMWGTVIAVCSIIRWAQFQFSFELPFDIMWLTVAAVIPQVWIAMRERKTQKVKTYDGIYMQYIWMGFGIGICLLILIVNVAYSAWAPAATAYRDLKGTSATHFGEFIAPLFLLLYGMPTFITGAACKFKPMLIGGIICWICCVITVFSDVKADLLLTAFSAIFAWLIPGIFLERDYRKAKKEESVRHV